MTEAMVVADDQHTDVKTFTKQLHELACREQGQFFGKWKHDAIICFRLLDKSCFLWQTSKPLRAVITLHDLTWMHGKGYQGAMEVPLAGFSANLFDKETMATV